MSDDDIKAFLRGDYDRVVRAVALVCGDRQRAEDAVQDALVDVWTKRRAVDDLSGWVATAALNRARSRWRSLSAERRAFSRLADRSAHRQAPVEPAATFDARLAAALRNLPRGQREVIALHYLLDMSVAVVAERLGLAEGTVKTHLHRGRAALRVALGEEADREEVGHV